MNVTMSVEAWKVWLYLAQYWVFTAGMIGIVAGLSIERLAKSHGWPTVRRCVPALAVAVILAVIMAAHRAGQMPTPRETQTAVDALHVRKSVMYMPYCDDWFYYMNMLCWIAQ